jgi:hypothetical protein
MTRQAQKDEELFYLSQFRKASGLLPDAKVEPHEVPDFLIRTTFELVGVEITKYYIPTPSDSRPRQEQEALRRQVLSKASALYATLWNGRIRVSAFFNGNVSLRTNHISDLAKRLVDVVLNYQPNPWEQIDVQWEDGLSRLPELSALLINGYPTEMESEWVGPDANYIPNVTPEEIQKIADGKTARIPRYRTDISSKWLLIIMDGFSMSSTASVPQGVTSHRFQGKFDRLFLFEAFGSRVHELFVTP